MRCSCSFSIENGLPCRHILAYCTHNMTDVNLQSICDRWLHSDTYLTRIAVENYFPMQLSQPSMKNTLIALVRRLSEEQCSSLYSQFYQELHGRIPPTPLNLQAEPQLFTGTSMSTNFTTPLMHRVNVDLDETSSNDEDDVVSINSEELTERDIKNEEDEENRLCDICNLAQPPCETGDEIWEDEYLKWNEPEFGNVRTLRVPAEQVWTPDTYVFNNSGKVSWPIPVQLKTSCKVDITLFPFDHQNCEIQFGSWMYTSDWIKYKFQTDQHNKSTTMKNWKYSKKLSSSLVSLLSNTSNRHLTTERRDHDEIGQDDLDNNNNNNNNFEEDYLTRNALDTSSYWDSTDWMLKHAILSYTHRSTDTLTVWKPTTSILNIQFHDNKLDTRQTDLVLKLFLQRRSFFYIWNIVVPCILLTLLTLITFWTPIDSGEKVTLGLSVFLAFSMFMMLIAERVPPTAKNIPLIGVYMTSVMSITTGTVVVCVIVINLDAKGEKLSRAPKWLRRITQFSLFQLFYKENCCDVNESAAVSSLKSYLKDECSLNGTSFSPIYYHNIIVNESNHHGTLIDLSIPLKVKPLSTIQSITLNRTNINSQIHKAYKVYSSMERDCLLKNDLSSSSSILNLTTCNVHSNNNHSQSEYQLNLKSQEDVRNELIKYEWKTH
uniref:Acetylcholine receptor subunit alpha-like 1 n=1 Tax=Schistosoma haematobium TaxID=6185 RepID=A0A095CBC3_SCHHA